jgi:hypothetical protein
MADTIQHSVHVGAIASLWCKGRISLWRWRRTLAPALLSIVLLGNVLIFANLHMQQDARLGVVHFPTSCSWHSQHDFITATSLLHLFQFADAERTYRPSSSAS